MRPKRTPHQREIMGVILKAAGEGRFLKQNEMPALLTYGADVTFGAIRASIRALEDQGMLVRVKDGCYRKLVPTERGFDWFRAAR
jgi:predicted transcriptional regulator